MKFASIVFAFGAFVTGLIAARYWYRSTQVVIDPGWSLPGMGGYIEPVDPELRQLDMNVATDKAFQSASELNKIASYWTAASVALSGVSSVLGAFG